MDNLNEIRKMTPEARIKRLKELEEKNKKEIQEAERLISEAQDDIDKEKLIDEIPIPEIKKTDIDDLFEVETLDDVVGPIENAPGIEYRIPPEIESEITNIYNQLNELRYTSEWSSQEYDSFNSAAERLSQIKNDFEDKVKQGYTLSQETTNQLVVSQNVEYNIRKYREFGK